MKQLALNDYANAMRAKDSLVVAMRSGFTLGGTVQDADGNILNPLADATKAYQENVIRMTGPLTATLVPGSMKLTLGAVAGLATDEPIPQPPSYANMADSAQVGGNYKSCVNVSYGTCDFVLAPASNNTELVDYKEFRTSMPGLPYLIPSVVQCEADETFVQNDQNNGPVKRTLHASACAEPGCMIDYRPHPGMLCVAVQGAPLPELTNLQDALYEGVWNGNPCDYFVTPSGDDYLPAKLNDLKLPYFSDAHPRLGAVMSVALYDWLRRCGPTINVDSFFQAMTAGLAANGNGVATTYSKDGTGKVTVTASSDGSVLPSVSQNQYIAISSLAIESKNQQNYDVIVVDSGLLCGRPQGGQHAGEPLLVPDPPPSYVVPPSASSGTGFPLIPVPNVAFPKGTGVRPTYSTDGIAVDVIFRERVSVP
jgi:hypothetical protein